MIVEVKDLDKTVKNKIRQEVLDRMLKKDRKLPLPNETDKIAEVLNSDTMTVCTNIIKEYYREFFESDTIDVSLSVEDVINIYQNRI